MDKNLIKKLAVYPGTFDPLTFGHENLVLRATTIFEELIVAIAENKNKNPFFSIDERYVMAKQVLAKYPNVRIEKFYGLLKDFMKYTGASIILRGLRASSDFEYELQMAGMNHQLMPHIETIFLTPSIQYHFISGQMVRSIAQLHGDISTFVAQPIIEQFKKRLAKQTIL